MTSEVEKITDLLTTAFEKNAWYGPSIMEVLDEIDPQTVHHKTGSLHSIIELVSHVITWRDFATRRLSGNTLFEVSDTLNFPAAESWIETLTSLRQSQNELLSELKKFPDARLHEIVPGRTYDFFTLIHGVIHHDIYHLGQIVLLKKLAGKNLSL